jgi:hypothetical protein
MKQSRVSISSLGSVSECVSSLDVPNGTYFIGTIPQGSDSVTGLFVCAYDHRLILLNNPQRTWSGNTTINDFRVVDVDINVRIAP